MLQHIHRTFVQLIYFSFKSPPFPEGKGENRACSGSELSVDVSDAFCCPHQTQQVIPGSLNTSANTTSHLG